jgi:hypothetical protein
MSDELLRHLALNAGKLKKTKHFDPELSKERQRLEGDTWLRLLGVLCYHANQKERQVWCGIHRLAKEAGCNTDRVYRYLPLFESLGWITKRPPRKADAHHKPASCWEITLPDLEPLEAWKAKLEQQEREWEESSPVHTPVHTPLHTPRKSANGANIDADGVEGGEQEHKHKTSREKKSHLRVIPSHGTEEKSLLEITLEIYAEKAAAKAFNAIANPEAWKAKLIGNAYKNKPQGSDLTYSERAQRALEAGYKPLDIGNWLADGCLSNGSMNSWDKRPDFTETPSQEALGASQSDRSEVELRDIERHLGKQFQAKEAEPF